MFLRVLWNCYETSRNQWLAPHQLRRLQERRLRALVNHAYQNVPLYREKFDAAKIKPDDITTLEDLVKLPFVTKREIRAGFPEKSLARGYTEKDFMRTFTSGTSGGPMLVLRDKRFFDKHVAEKHYRNLTAIGFRFTDKQAELSYHRPGPFRSNGNGAGKNKTKTSQGRVALGPLVSLFRRWKKNVYIAYSGDEVLPDLTAYQPTILKSSPAYLRLAAEQVQDRSARPFHPQALISNGAVLDEPTRMYLESVFECPVYDWYGAREAPAVAWECRKQEGKHISATMYLLETVHNGKPVKPGETGEMVITELENYGMPMIRYRLGDIGILDDHRCSCGRAFPLLKSVEGRLVDAFLLPDGSAVTPKAVMTAIQGTPGVSRYQAVQEREDRVRVELMARPRDPPIAVDELEARCHTLLGDDVDIHVTITDRTDLKAKFRPVISKLTVAGEPRWTKPRQRTDKRVLLATL